jgi:signal transduction histidine kinase/CheY-like chemotaxis protein
VSLIEIIRGQFNKNRISTQSESSEIHLHHFAFLAIIFDISFGLFAYFAFDNLSGLLINTGSAALLLIGIYVRKKRYISRLVSENLLIAIAYSSLIFLIVNTGGIASPVIAWFAILNSVAITLINKKSAWMWTIIGLISILIIFIMQSLGFQFKNQYAGNYYFTYLFICAIGLVFLSQIISFLIDLRNEEYIKLLNKKNEELENSNNEIALLQKYKEQFLANITHELRTPLNAIKGISTLLSYPQNTKDETDELHEGLIKSSDHLMTLINEILDYSKLNSGKLILSRQPFVLNETLNTAFNMLKHNLSNKDIELKFKSNVDSNFTVLGDATRLMQILINIGGNSLKFTKKGSVSLVCELVKNSNNKTCMLNIGIKDTGIGISEDQLSNLFQDYSQANENIYNKYGGTGLGLSISKKLVELQNGTVVCESKLGEGTNFYIELPFKVYKGANLFEKETIRESLTWAGNVLIVDDNELNLFIAGKLIQKIIPNAQILTCDSGMAAIKVAEETNIDLLFLDFQMPELDGKATTELIRKNDAIFQPAIIGLSASTSESDIADSFKSGMNDYLSKPLDDLKLYNTIKKWIAIEEKSKKHTA